MPSIGLESKGSNPVPRAKSERDLVVKCENKGYKWQWVQMAMGTSGKKKRSLFFFFIYFFSLYNQNLKQNYNTII
jgi:hypothetical protein